MARKRAGIITRPVFHPCHARASGNRLLSLSRHGYGTRTFPVPRLSNSARPGVRRVAVTAVGIVSPLGYGLAATLAATLVATKTVNAAGQPLIDGRILNSILVMVLVTAIVGPVLTQRFAPRMFESRSGAGAGPGSGDDPI